ncbi:MAG: DUF2059 domain-containing protein [Victivallales bacterium]|nr:DUF2059 domain-containing protein [Victivallales bacterium]
MKWKTMLCLAMMIVSTGLFAGNKEKLVEEMLVLSGIPDRLNQVTSQVIKVQTDVISQQSDLSPERKQQIIAFQKQVMSKVMATLGWDKIKNDYIKIYSEVYTEDELNAVIAFMKSPAGRKMREKSPQLMEKAMRLAQRKMQTLLPELQQMERDFAARTKASKKAAAPQQ